MRERDISEQDISEVLSQPDSLSRGEKGALIAKGIVGGQRLTVVYRDLSAGRYLVITVYREG